MEKSLKNTKDARKRIIEAAIKNFAKKGFSDTSLRDIGRDAKVSKGGLYHYFPTKEDVFVEVCITSRELTLKKTLEFLENNGALIGKERDLIGNLSQYYDQIVVKNNILERIWIEGMLEGSKNPKLRKLMLKNEKENLNRGTQWLRQMRDNSNLFQGYSDSDLLDIARGIVATYRGLIIDSIIGKNPKDIRMAWIKTLYALYKSKK